MLGCPDAAAAAAVAAAAVAAAAAAEKWTLYTLMNVYVDIGAHAPL